MVTPALLLQHRDRSVYPNYLYSIGQLSCPGRIAVASRDSVSRLVARENGDRERGGS